MLKGSVTSFKSLVVILLIVVVTAACKKQLQNDVASHNEMIDLLKGAQRRAARPANMFSPEAKLLHVDSLLKFSDTTPEKIATDIYSKANALLELGSEPEAIELLKQLETAGRADNIRRIRKVLAMAYLRMGERSNCISNHASESCIIPIKGLGVYKNASSSRQAITIYEELLKEDPRDLESLWLLNLAYMTIGEYPGNVPPALLVPGLNDDDGEAIQPFEDIAGSLGLAINNMAGGSIAEDFDNDGYLDLMTSGWGNDDPMHYFKNNADGTFTDLSENVGLAGITGGLNIMQTDYNNDGYKDVFVLRGAWKKEFGQEPNSLLRNNGNGTFTDVTAQAGLLSFHPTQTATWNDFNNDGWLDLFIGNESLISVYDRPHPCELYINNQDGTFREIANEAHCAKMKYIKGVTSGDYDNDGWKDIFLSTLDGDKILLKNLGIKEKEVMFEDVSEQSGISLLKGSTFPTWFWDYNNDGWLDIFVCGYTIDKSLAGYAAAEQLGIPEYRAQRMILLKNQHDGTFFNVAKDVNLDRKVFGMGSNFGDIDNDGFLDMYIGTGNPLYQSLIPNKLFRNVEGRKFADVTTSARVGHLQKGHAVSLADMDNDGDQDIYEEMGGAYPGDAYQSSFFLNPGQGNNNWICLQLEGTKSNRAAIGSRVKLTFHENGVVRSVYRDVNSGGSFGSSPLRREIGIGKAEVIDEIEIRWHGGGEVQTFHNVKPNQFIRITEGNAHIETIHIKTLDWILPDRLCNPDGTPIMPAIQTQ